MSSAFAPAAPPPPFSEVYREFLPRITGFLRAKLNDAGDAEDVASQVFTRAFQAYARYEPWCTTPAAWLFRIARNAALDHERRAAQRQRAERAVVELWVNLEDPMELAEQRLSHRQLRHAIASLPVRQRQAVTLRLSGLSFKEVSRRLECNEDAAKMLYHRSLRALRTLIGEATAA